MHIQGKPQSITTHSNEIEDANYGTLSSVVQYQSYIMIFQTVIQ